MPKSNIRESIFEELQGQNRYTKNELYKKLARDLRCEEREVARILSLMMDDNEVIHADQDDRFVRLTAKGVKANSPWCQKVWTYLSKNWIAILALAVSIFN